MELKLELGQIFWLKVPLLIKKREYARPFLVYEVNEIDYILLKISSSLKDYIPQYPLVRKPSSLYKKSFVEPNILVYVKHDLFSYLLKEITGEVEQGQHVLQEDFKEIKKKIKECFSNEKFRGNRYKIRVV